MYSHNIIKDSYLINTELYATLSYRYFYLYYMFAKTEKKKLLLINLYGEVNSFFRFVQTCETKVDQLRL